ncbi:MAG: sulfite exporter TauE/SafE family protein [Candidatus Obscuribacterales bacterium]|nr:sulfite exporter TauE/SafE family protein [Candidatus Obscuribacterales bacterium]
MNFPDPITGSIEFVVALLAGAIAYVSGFGIGSILTPLFACQVDIQLAVAAVSIPHFVGTLWRFLLLRKSVNKEVLIQFGLLSAIGGLGGALLHSFSTDKTLVLIFAALLIFAGSTGLTGLSAKIRFGKKVAWLAGLLSGLFGGLVGNQGGIRSAALLGFDLTKEEFVATATAIALIVDLARMPVYFAYRLEDLLAWSPFIAVAVSGIVIGTISGKYLLSKIPDKIFKRVVAIVILVLGLSMLFAA